MVTDISLGQKHTPISVMIEIRKHYRSRPPLNRIGHNNVNRILNTIFRKEKDLDRSIFHKNKNKNSGNVRESKKRKNFFNTLKTDQRLINGKKIYVRYFKEMQPSS